VHDLPEKERNSLHPHQRATCSAVAKQFSKAASTLHYTKISEHDLVAL